MKKLLFAFTILLALLIASNKSQAFADSYNTTQTATIQSCMVQQFPYGPFNYDCNPQNATGMGGYVELKVTATPSVYNGQNTVGIVSCSVDHDADNPDYAYTYNWNIQGCDQLRYTEGTSHWINLTFNYGNAFGMGPQQSVSVKWDVNDQGNIFVKYAWSGSIGDCSPGGINMGADPLPGEFSPPDNNHQCIHFKTPSP